MTLAGGKIVSFEQFTATFPVAQAMHDNKGLGSVQVSSLAHRSSWSTRRMLCREGRVAETLNSAPRVEGRKTLRSGRSSPEGDLSFASTLHRLTRPSRWSKLSSCDQNDDATSTEPFARVRIKKPVCSNWHAAKMREAHDRPSLPYLPRSWFHLSRNSVVSPRSGISFEYHQSD